MIPVHYLFSSLFNRHAFTSAGAHFGYAMNTAAVVFGADRVSRMHLNRCLHQRAPLFGTNSHISGAAWCYVRFAFSSYLVYFAPYEPTSSANVNKSPTWFSYIICTDWFLLEHILRSQWKRLIIIIESDALENGIKVGYKVLAWMLKAVQRMVCRGEKGIPYVWRLVEMNIDQLYMTQWIALDQRKHKYSEERNFKKMPIWFIEQYAERTHGGC